jgi:hypothetical protein
MAPYFEDGGHMIDQAWQPRLTEGMVRCYLVRDRVAGFGLQAVNALYPAPDDGSAEAPLPGPRLYHPPDLPHLQALKRRLEDEWVPELQRLLAIAPDELPLLWDCDFMHGEPGAGRAGALRPLRDQRQQRRALSGFGDRAARRRGGGTDRRGAPAAAAGAPRPAIVRGRLTRPRRH